MRKFERFREKSKAKTELPERGRVKSKRYKSKRRIVKIQVFIYPILKSKERIFSDKNIGYEKLDIVSYARYRSWRRFFHVTLT